MYIAFLNLRTAVTTDDNISRQVTETKMTVSRGFLNLRNAVTSDDDISSSVTEVEFLKFLNS